MLLIRFFLYCASGAIRPCLIAASLFFFGCWEFQEWSEEDSASNSAGEYSSNATTDDSPLGSAEDSVGLDGTSTSSMDPGTGNTTDDNKLTDSSLDTSTSESSNFDTAKETDTTKDTDTDGLDNKTCLSWRTHGSRLYGGQGTFSDIALGDFNGDNIVDFAVTLTWDSAVRVFLGKGDSGVGDGTFEEGEAADCPDAIGHTKRTVEAADLNGDGILDLAVGNNSITPLCILLGNGAEGKGDGTFRFSANFPTSRGSRSIAVGDFNSDGFNDLAACNEAPYGFTLLLSAGTTAGGDPVLSRRSYNAFNGCSGIVTADFNGDDILDLAAVQSEASADGSKVSILLGWGSAGMDYGRFSLDSEHSYGLPWATALKAADFNADGAVDLVVGGYGAAVLLGDGHGNLSLEQTFFSEGDDERWFVDVAVGDLNGDGLLDIALANWGSSSVTVLRGQGVGGIGDGTFEHIGDYAAGNGPVGLAVADLNEDGASDFLVSNEGGEVSFVSVTMGSVSADYNGDGLLGARSILTGFPFDEVYSIASGDYNEDRIPDIWMSGPSSEAIRLGELEANAFDYSLAEKNHSWFGGGRAKSSAVADFDGDGLEDLAALSDSSVRVSLSRGAAGVVDDVFFDQSTVVDIPGSLSIHDRGELAVGDFNGDERLDLVAVYYGNSQNISVVLGDGLDSLSGSIRLKEPISYDLGDRSTSSVAIGDFDGDGINDLVIGDETGTSIALLTGLGQAGQGNGTFDVDHPTLIETGDLVRHVDARDFDKDGNLDVVTVGQNMTVLLGQGDGSFAVQEAIGVAYGLAATDLIVSDLNRDGLLDIVVAIADAGGVAVFYGQGSEGVSDGTFVSVGLFATGRWPSSLTVNDFNRDGGPDLAIAHSFAPAISILLDECIAYE